MLLLSWLRVVLGCGAGFRVEMRCWLRLSQDDAAGSIVLIICVAVGIARLCLPSMPYLQHCICDFGCHLHITTATLPPGSGTTSSIGNLSTHSTNALVHVLVLVAVHCTCVPAGTLIKIGQLVLFRY